MITDNPEHEFEDKLHGKHYLFHATKDPLGVISLSLFPKESKEFNNEYPEVRIQIKGQIPDEARCIGSIRLSGAELMTITSKTLAQYAK
ncbi:MAG: hypothetical protein P4L41_10300 [Flavipsychrobacter sp.]|nr:hypothetical protein [Flavipsychrobacter sp.]